MKSRRLPFLLAACILIAATAGLHDDGDSGGTLGGGRGVSWCSAGSCG